MEAVINPIRSIIIYNPGSAGDFITALCLTQLYDKDLHKLLEHGRMLVDTDYFKKTSQDMFYQTQPTAWDLSQLKQVENTHFYLDAYHEIADQCFYIDYPDHLQGEIMKIYSYKIFRNDMEKFLARHLPSLHTSLQSKVDHKNALEIFNILWLKSLRSWRDRPDLLRISLADFFDRTKMISMVETIIKDKIKHPGKFDMVYSQWMEKNQTMKEIFN